MARSIATRFLVLSDTHGDTIVTPRERVDVVIHCGDMTEHSKLEEFRTTIENLKNINAPLKLVIPGNHDFSLDLPMFKKKLAEAKLDEDDDAVKRDYGLCGEAQQLFSDVKRDGIMLLDEGTHRFTLSNGAQLTVYASPFTPSTNDWGFQYDPQEDHAWNIGTDVDVAITHGPPRGIFDQTASNSRGGSGSLFRAMANSRPQMHCFGHMHAGWGAKLVAWRDDLDENFELSHFTAIDNEQSKSVESLFTLQGRRFDTDEVKAEKASRLEAHTRRGYCDAVGPEVKGSRTLFINAAIEGSEEYPKHLPWIAQIMLPGSESSDSPAPKSVKRKMDGDNRAVI
jgi:Icc-related predicted phosphoesterase